MKFKVGQFEIYPTFFVKFEKNNGHLGEHRHAFLRSYKPQKNQPSGEHFKKYAFCSQIALICFA